MSQTRSYFVGIDVGTGSARACVTDDNGEIKGLASKPTALSQPKHEYYEQSTADIWECICESVKGAVKESGIDPAAVKGLGFDATCSLAVFDKATGQPISVTPGFKSDRNVVLWLDHRSEEETALINQTGHDVLQYVGGKVSSEMEIPKILWLKNNMPTELFQRCNFFDLADALTYIATSKETRSFCSTVCKQTYVPRGAAKGPAGWQETFFKQIGLEELARNGFEQLGGIDGQNGDFRSAGQLVGGLSEQAANELGLSPGTPVGSGVIDAYAGWIGTVGASTTSKDQAAPDISNSFSRLAAVAGTSTCHLVISPDPHFVKGVWGPYRDVLFPDHWMAEGGQSATGELLKHMLEIHPAYSEAATISKEKNESIYSVLDRHLEEMRVAAKAPHVSLLAKHFFFYGDLFGNRSPVADTKMTGSIVGLNSDKSMNSLAIQYYATMEFIALQTKQIVETMNASGHKIRSIYFSGSQCQNATLMELVATTCGMSVYIPHYIHAAVVHGASMLGAKAASAATGHDENLWSIMARLTKPAKEIRGTDQSATKRLLDAKYKVFLEQCDAQQRYRKTIDDATK